MKFQDLLKPKKDCSCRLSTPTFLLAHTQDKIPKKSGQKQCLIIFKLFQYIRKNCRFDR